MAAARLGLRCQVFSPDPDSPAFDVVLNATCAEYADVEALELFANDVDVITYEFENVPAATAMILAARRPVLPDRKILETTQDRLIEKDFVKQLGIGTADYADVSSAASLRAAIARIGLPAVLKTRRFGYDGKGQAIIREGDDPDQDLGGTRHQIRHPRGLHSVRARNLGDRRALGRRPCRMLRCHRKRASRPHPEDLARAGRVSRTHWRREARAIAERIAGALDYVGVLAVEMFVVQAQWRTEAPGQRDRAAGAQFRALDPRRRLDLAVRAAHPRHCRLAAGQTGPSRPGHHDQPDRRRRSTTTSDG